MTKAEEMQKIAKEIAIKEADEEYPPIIAAIKRAAEGGSRAYSYSSIPNNETIDRLRNDGFIISFLKGSMIVSW